MLGLDYKFHRTPVNMSLDWQPAWEFGTGRCFYGNWGGFAVRYSFWNKIHLPLLDYVDIFPWIIREAA